MKLTVLATAAILAASASSAADLNLGGQTISLGGEVDANYNTGTEKWGMDLIPEASVNAWGVDFSASTTFDLMTLNDDDADLFQGLDFEAGYTIPNTGLRAYVEVGTDKDLEFGDAVVGASFSF